MTHAELMEEIASAQAEMATWPEWKKKATQLEGFCPYYDKVQKELKEQE